MWPPSGVESKAAQTTQFMQLNLLSKLFVSIYNLYKASAVWAGKYMLYVHCRSHPNTISQADSYRAGLVQHHLLEVMML